MKITSQQLKKFGKKAAATAAGLFAAAAIAISGLVDSPDELFTGTPQAAQVVIAAAEEDERAVAKSVSAEPAQKEHLRDKLRRLFFAQPSAVRGVVLLPFWAIGKVLIGFFSLLFTALSPVLQIIIGVLLNALLLFGLFALVFKLLFPNLSLRKFLTKRNIILLTVGALLLSATDAILRANWADYRPISIAIKLVVGLIVLSLLAWRIFGKRIQQQLNPAT
ncbi:MAG: hypothetical protein ABFC56_06210 [Clostridiaceae bacterium]